MCHPIEKRRGHFGIAKDGDPFPELQVGCEYNAGCLIELADQVEQQCAPGLWEWNIADFIDNDTIQ